MALQQRAKRQSVGVPESIGMGALALLAVTAFWWLNAYAEFISSPPEFPQEAVITPAYPSSPGTFEDQLRRVLEDMELDFQYTELDSPIPNNYQDNYAPVDGQPTMPNMPRVAMAAPGMRFSEGAGGFSVVLPSMTPSEIQAGLGQLQAVVRPRIPMPKPHIGRAMLFGLLYAATLYYFCRVYPAWRETY